MSQDWTDDCYAAGHVAQTDLQNMKKNFGCLRSLFLGASQPASMAAGHPWLDSGNNVFKFRNPGDSAWWGVMHGDTSQKMWVYRNSAMDGWIVDSNVSDKVIAIKGGSTYTTGGATAGTWTQPSHTLTLSEMPAHTHSYDRHDSLSGVYGGATFSAQKDKESHATSSVGGGNAHNHGTTYRPAAAVGTLQYLAL